MPVLNIEGKRVTVDDSFMSLSPEEQASTVDEIAQSLGINAGSVQSSPEAAPPVEETSDENAGILRGYQTQFENIIPGIPVVGPLIQKGSDYISSNLIGLATGENAADIRANAEKNRAQRAADRPIMAGAGQLAGSIAATGALGSTATGAKMLGMAGKSLLGRAGASAASSGLINSADTAIRGGDSADVLASGAMGLGLGGAIPLAGAGIRAVSSAIADKVRPTYNALRNPVDEASRRLGSAVGRDIQANPSSVMSQADEAAAKAAGINVINADRGGETTRAFARSVGNQSPEARSMIEKTAQDRFHGQASRASNFLKRVVGGNVDDLGARESLKKAARAANKPAYDAAFKAPNAQQIWNKDVVRLMGSPELRRAAMSASDTGATRSVVEGFEAIKNPFVIKDGKMALRQLPNGEKAVPNLRFWDQVKRNLDDQIGVAQRAGKNTKAADLVGLKQELTKVLDDAVPSYKTARAGASAFFGAEDALDAGRKFANSPRSLPETKQAFSKFSSAEKKLFQNGYMSEMIDKLKASNDGRNVINSTFNNEASRETMRMILSPHQMRELEAYVRVETLVDQLRGAMGNSTTARQWAEMGLGAAGGAAMSDGSWEGMALGGLTGAVAGRVAGAGARAIYTNANAKVLEEAGRMLTSNDPKIIENAVKRAATSPAFMKALEQIQWSLGIASRGAVLAPN